MTEITTEHKSNSTKHSDSLYLLIFFFKWRKILMIVALLAAIASTTVSFIIPEKFKSTVILFPAPSVSISKSLMSRDGSPQSDLLRFGEEDDLERMMQVLNSEEIRDRIINKYKLAPHYGIEETNKFKKTLLRAQYDDNIRFKKTEYMSLKIEVHDTDPQMASNIANDIAALYDSTMRRMKRERALEAYNIMKREYENFQKEVKLKEDSLNKLMELGINDYESQAERMNEALGKAIVEGKTAAAAELERKLKILSNYGTAYITLRDNIYRMREQLNLLAGRYEATRVDVEQNLPEKFVVDKAFPAEKKSYPVRWLIVTVSTLSSLIISMLAIALIENFKKIRQTILSE